MSFLCSAIRRSCCDTFVTKKVACGGCSCGHDIVPLSSTVQAHQYVSEFEIHALYCCHALNKDC